MIGIIVGILPAVGIGRGSLGLGLPPPLDLAAGIAVPERAGMYIHTYIYIYREREREIHTHISCYILVYIYIEREMYTYTYIDIYIYIYIADIVLSMPFVYIQKYTCKGVWRQGIMSKHNNCLQKEPMPCRTMPLLVQLRYMCALIFVYDCYSSVLWFLFSRGRFVSSMFFLHMSSLVT